MTRWVRRAFCGLAIASLFLIIPAPGQQGARNGEWRTYGGDEASTRYSPLDQINRDTIKNMRVAWVWKSDSLLPGAQPASETTPIMVNGVLYFTMDQRRYVIAANAGTGETLWMYRPNIPAMPESGDLSRSTRSWDTFISTWSRQATIPMADRVTETTSTQTASSAWISAMGR